MRDQLVARGQREVEVAVLACDLRRDRIDARARPIHTVGQHDIASEIASTGFQAGLRVVLRVFRNHELVAVAWAGHLDDRHFRSGLEREREFPGDPLVRLSGCHRGQWIDVRHPIVVDVELLVIGDLDFLARVGRDREHAHLERLVIGLLEQSGIFPLLLVAVVDLSRLVLLHHFADHLFVVDPHAEVGDGCAAWNGKAVQRLDLTVLRVPEHLRDLSDRDPAVDRHTDGVLFNRQHPAEPAIRDQQARGLR